jgi:hypothetical protein
MKDVGAYRALMEPVLDNARIISASAGLWFTLQLLIDYVVPALFPKWHAKIVAASRKEDWGAIRSRIIGMIFSVYASVICTYLLCFDPPDPHNFYERHPSVSITRHCNPSSRASHLICAQVQTWVVGVAVGYFIWDVVLCVRERWGLDYLFHGIAVLAVYCAALYPFLHYMSCVCLLFEASTPFLHARKLMWTFGWSDSHPAVFHLTSMAFAGTFFVARIVVGLWATASWWMDMMEHLSSGEYHSLTVMIIFLVSSLLLNGLNVMWFSQIVGAALNPTKLKNLNKHK